MLKSFFSTFTTYPAKYECEDYRTVSTDKGAWKVLSIWWIPVLIVTSNVSTNFVREVRWFLNKAALWYCRGSCDQNRCPVPFGANVNFRLRAYSHSRCVSRFFFAARSAQFSSRTTFLQLALLELHVRRKSADTLPEQEESNHKPLSFSSPRSARICN